MPAGLGILCVSQKGLAAFQHSKSPRAFFDLRDHVKHNVDGYFPYTPSLAHLYGLRESLDMLLAEGMPNVAARHRRLGEGVRRAVKAWNLGVCTKDPARQSDTVTAIVVPGGSSVDSPMILPIAPPVCSWITTQPDVPVRMASSTTTVLPSLCCSTPFRKKDPLSPISWGAMAASAVVAVP